MEEGRKEGVRKKREGGGVRVKVKWEPYIVIIRVSTAQELIQGALSKTHDISTFNDLEHKITPHGLSRDHTYIHMYMLRA